MVISDKFPPLADAQKDRADTRVQRLHWGTRGGAVGSQDEDAEEQGTPTHRRQSLALNRQL